MKKKKTTIFNKTKYITCIPTKCIKYTLGTVYDCNIIGRYNILRYY